MAKRKKRATDGGPPALETCRLSKSYGDLVALGPLDVAVERGELVTLIGHNGSGKSTLLQLVAGLLDPSDGSVEVLGEPAGSMPARAALTYLGDNPILYDDLSVREHLEYLCRLHAVDDWVEASSNLLERFGLDDRADDLPARFSRGLRQKTALVIGLVRRAPVVLIDEPFVGLDSAGRDALVAVLHEQSAAGTTIVLATHDDAALGVADRCLVLHDGTLVHDGTPGATMAQTAR